VEWPRLNCYTLSCPFGYWQGLLIYRDGATLGYVSTLGNLHDGPVSLVTQAKKHASVTVASIFLKPTHFRPGEDYDSYPRIFDEDCARLRAVRGLESGKVHSFVQRLACGPSSIICRMALSIS
jgi:hypothetical protein